MRKKFSRTQLLHFTANQLNVPILAGSSADLPQADNVRVGRDPGTMALALTVSDVKAAVAFYQKGFGFAKRGVMNGPDGKPMHAELTLRGTTLMLGPENTAMGRRSAKSVGSSLAGLALWIDSARY